MKHIRLIDTMYQYNNTDQTTIKGNIKRLMKQNSTERKKITDMCNISVHTGHSYTNVANPNKPGLYNLCILAAYWEIDITELLRDH